VVVESDDDGVDVEVRRRDLLLDGDQALAALNKVMGRGLLKVIRAKRTLKRGFIVAVANGADGH